MDYPPFSLRRHSIQEPFATAWSPLDAPRRPQTAPNYCFISSIYPTYSSALSIQAPTYYPTTSPIVSGGRTSSSSSVNSLVPPHDPMYSNLPPSLVASVTSAQPNSPRLPDSPGSSAPGPKRVRKQSVQGHLARPANAFILYRCEQVRLLKRDGASSMLQSEISKVVRSRWRSLPVEERKVWDDRADDTKTKHQADHPEYRFKRVLQDKQMSDNSSHTSLAPLCEE